MNRSIDYSGAKNSPREESKGHGLSDYIAMLPSTQKNNSRRNDALSRSVAVTSERSSVRNAAALQVLSGTGAAPRHRRGESAIEIRDIIDAG